MRARRRPSFNEHRRGSAETAELGISAGPGGSFIMLLSASATEPASGARHHAQCDRFIFSSVGAAAVGRTRPSICRFQTRQQFQRRIGIIFIELSLDGVSAGIHQRLVWTESAHPVGSAYELLVERSY